MSYHSDLAIDTRTCGQADEDTWLDIRDGYASGAADDTTWIWRNQDSGDYDVWDDGQLVGSGRTFHEAEIKRVQYLRARPLPMDGSDYHVFGEE